MNKLIPIDELLEIVTDAGLLHQRDFYETSLSRLVAKDGDPLADLSTAYEVAGSLGIPEERIDAAIAKRYPTAQEQLEVLETHGAIATTRAVARTYQAELAATLRRELPSRVFEAELERSGRPFDQPYLDVKWRRDYTVRIVLVGQIDVPEPPQHGWRKVLGLQPKPAVQASRREELLLATIQVGNELLPYAEPLDSKTGPRARFRRGDRLYLVVTVGSGVFLKLCSAKLDELKSRFDRHNGVAGHEVIYDYVVDR